MATLISFQGFLRRVHRWPVLVGGDADALEKRGSGLSVSASSSRTESDHGRVRGRLQDVLSTMASAGADPIVVKGTINADYQTTARRTSAAQTTLQMLRNRDIQKAPDPNLARNRSDSLATISSEHVRKMQQNTASAYAVSSSPGTLARLSPDTINSLELADSEHSSGGRSMLGLSRPRLSRSPSIPLSALQAPGPPYPPDLLKILDGEHHTDEICTRFEVGWPTLENWLRIAGGGSEEEDFGRIVMIYR